MALLLLAGFEVGWRLKPEPPECRPEIRRALEDNGCFCVPSREHESLYICEIGRGAGDHRDMSETVAMAGTR